MKYILTDVKDGCEDRFVGNNNDGPLRPLSTAFL